MNGWRFCGRSAPGRSLTISNRASDRSCSRLTMDISLMRLLDHDEYVCRESMSDVAKVQTERASGSQLNWRCKVDLDTFGIYVLFRTLWYQNWVFGTIFGIWYHIWYLVSYLVFGTIFGVRKKPHFDTCSKGRYLQKWYQLDKGAIFTEADICLKTVLQDRVCIVIVSLLNGW